jgi:hypothetical protein
LTIQLRSLNYIWHPFQQYVVARVAIPHKVGEYEEGGVHWSTDKEATVAHYPLTYTTIIDFLLFTGRKVFFNFFCYVPAVFRIRKFSRKEIQLKILIYLFLIKNNHLLVLTYLLVLVQEKPSALKREHPALQKMKFNNFFQFLWVIFAILDQDPDPADQN